MQEREQDIPDQSKNIPLLGKFPEGECNEAKVQQVTTFIPSPVATASAHGASGV